MTARADRLGAALYSTESNWAEATATTSTRLQITNPVDLSGFVEDRLEVNPTVQRMHDGEMGVRGPQSGSFTIEQLLTGYGATTASGALSATALGTFLSNVVGNIDVASVGTLTEASGTASVFDVDTGTGTFAAGDLFRLGSLGDARGNGQWGVCSTFETDTMTGLVAFDAAPNDDDVLYACQLIYPSENPGAEDITSTRWRLMTGNKQVLARGCFPTALEFTGLNAGELPRVRTTFGVSRWQQDLTETFPDATATAAKDGAIVAGGSFFYNDVGTATRKTATLRDFAVTIDYQTQPLFSHNGVDQYQNITGAKRLMQKCTVRTVFDAAANGTETWDDIYTGGTYQHLLNSLSTVDGKAIAFYAPRARIARRPVQVGRDGLNRVEVVWICETGPTTTSNKTLSSWRLGMA